MSAYAARCIQPASVFSSLPVALRRHKMPRIWLEYLAFLMEQRKITRIRKTFDRALQSLPITQVLRYATRGCAVAVGVAPPAAHLSIGYRINLRSFAFTHCCCAARPDLEAVPQVGARG